MVFSTSTIFDAFNTAVFNNTSSLTEKLLLTACYNDLSNN